MALNLTTNSRYTTVAIILHWVLAILVLSLIPVGWWMGDAILEKASRAQALQVFPLHKATGMTVLSLTVFRLFWRLTHKAPPLPQLMPAWERLTARATHWLFYGLLLAMPLTGWIYSSAGYSEAFHTFISVPITWFGLFTIPEFPGLSSQADEVRKSVGLTAVAIHSKLAWVMLALAGLHVAAALKHHFVNKDDVLTRMVPILKPKA